MTERKTKMKYVRVLSRYTASSISEDDAEHSVNTMAFEKGKEESTVVVVAMDYLLATLHSTGQELSGRIRCKRGIIAIKE